jgi:hypothetical protein
MHIVTKQQAYKGVITGKTVIIYRNNVNPENPLSLGLVKVSRLDLTVEISFSKEVTLSENEKLKFRFNHLVANFEYCNSNIGNKTCYAIA